MRERRKYTVSSSDKVLNNNNPNRREDNQKPISDAIIANYLRNMKAFFNFLKTEREITVNPMDTVEQIKPKRNQNQLLSPEVYVLLNVVQMPEDID